jgi:hypothetical protein
MFAAAGNALFWSHGSCYKGNAYYSPPPKIGNTLNQDNEKKIVIEIKPGKENFSSGDRSDTTA